MTSARLLAAGALALTITVYLARLNGVVGQYVDDAWYVLFAHALAAGDGYRLVSAPTPELAAVLPASPPGFALVLALVVLLTPAFPANVVALKAVSIAAMIGVGALAAVYYRHRGLSTSLALALALVVALTPAFVWLATSTVMSEPLFTFAQLAAVVLVMRQRPVLAGGAAAAAALIRSAGLPLIAAVVTWYVVRRQWRAAVMFVATAAVAFVPWAIYARAHAVPLEQRLAHGGAHVFTYGEQFWMGRAGEIGSGQVTIADIPARVATSLFDVFGRDVGAVVLPALYRPPIESGEETLSVGGTRSATGTGSMGNAPGTIVVSLLLSAIALIGFVARWRRGPDLGDYLVPFALVPVLLFPHWAYRLVLPLTPFLYASLVAGVQALTSAWPRVLRVALGCLVCLHLVDHAWYRLQIADAVWLTEARGADDVLSWMTRELKEPGHVASTNPALVFLRTGRRGVAIDSARERWPQWKAMGVRYLVAVRWTELPGAEVPYRVLFRRPDSGLWVLELTD